jgi:hypothetical protein
MRSKGCVSACHAQHLHDMACCLWVLACMLSATGQSCILRFFHSSIERRVEQSDEACTFFAFC